MSSFTLRQACRDGVNSALGILAVKVAHCQWFAPGMQKVQFFLGRCLFRPEKTVAKRSLAQPARRPKQEEKSNGRIDLFLINLLIN